MQSFAIAGLHYDLLHVNEDDSRVVVDEDGTELLKFDSTLNIINNDGGRIGRLTATGNQWHLIHDAGKVVPLEIPCNDYGWREMVLAEVAASKLLLS